MLRVVRYQAFQRFAIAVDGVPGHLLERHGVGHLQLLRTSVLPCRAADLGGPGSPHFYWTKATRAL